MKTENDSPVVVVGAGPAGLSAALELAEQGRQVVVFEKTGKAGGIARTEEYKGYYFDIGGHRFFSKIGKVNDVWHEVLGQDFLTVPRMSRIYYKGCLFDYPLSLSNVLLNLGPIESLLILGSYIKALLFPHEAENTFEQWVSNRFGERLYRIFFKTYTEKVWGRPCDKILASWAEQRIKGLSLSAALSNALFGAQGGKSLISEFRYPVRGAGMMWDRFREAVESRGGRAVFNCPVVCLTHEGGRILSIDCVENGEVVRHPVGAVISSLPISRLVTLLDPKAPAEVVAASAGLAYRAFIIVVLIVRKKELFPDQWMYIHSPDVRVGRIQNFKNWSADMVPEPETSSLGMEYFCDEGDEVWRMTDGQMAAMAAQELDRLGMARANEVEDAVVVRQPKAYPVYDEGYGQRVEVIREFLGAFENLQTVGRNGMHRYNNMDHSMYTGMLAARNVMGARHDLWNVNEEEAYLEEDRGAKAERGLVEDILGASFTRMDKLGFATAVGCVSGILMFLATIWLVLKGGEVVGPNLQLLSQYFLGFTVSVKGALIAASYTFSWAFLFGWLFAYIRNLLLGLYLYRLKRGAEALSLADFFEHF